MHIVSCETSRFSFSRVWMRCVSRAASGAGKRSPHEESINPTFRQEFQEVKLVFEAE